MPNETSFAQLDDIARITNASGGRIMLFRTASLWLARIHERARGSRSGRAREDASL